MEYWERNVLGGCRRDFSHDRPPGTDSVAFPVAKLAKRLAGTALPFMLQNVFAFALPRAI